MSVTVYDHPHSEPDKVEVLKYKLFRQVAWYCLLLHLLLIGVFAHLGVTLLAWVNVGSVATWGIGIWLLDKGNSSLALRIFCAEVAIHASLVCAHLGMSLGFQYYLWTVSCLVLLDYQLKLSHAVVAALIMIATFALLNLGYADITYHYAYPELVPYVHVLNVLICGIPMIYTIGQIREITFKQRHELAELAAIDPLTQLYNRRYATGLIHQAHESSLQTQTPLCVVMADIDHFKRINDSFGHDKGDDILRNVTEQLRLHMHPADIPVRWGGEEFLLVLSPCSLGQAMARMESLRIAIAEHAFAHNMLRVTMSFGVVEWGKDMDFKSVLQHADAALYDSKHAGRNKVTAAPVMSITSQRTKP
ncbi:GGDEF domain-containing protein [Pseudoalteromonas fenneropenaei]|uniref:diguanylate cyclase n=1 Tax=Pseudoalteromonas fenneropenaei TaxID=1737459 RepID=A0ABV7CP91_9GAMM